MTRTVGVSQLGEETREVEGLAAEDERTVFAGPLVAGPVLGQLDAVVVHIVQVDRLVRTVVGSAVNAPVGIQQPCEGDSQIMSHGVVYSEVIEARGACGRWLTAEALPCIEADVVVVPTRR